ncbi:Aristolochene synthase in complex with 12,13 Difluorofarnesyl diphosphate [Xylariaceae sp. FL1272]|nr:Aristolochene synthase in complex with 12,13 Difluorofarnesyl diphosphate [Xylariaceae sp. FL1272]
MPSADEPVVPDVPISYLQKALSHPRTDEAIEQVEGYFLKHWPFPNAKARKKFTAAGFSRVTCLYFPKALDDRIQSACMLLTILFLVDDMLEHMSLEEGAEYNRRLMDLAEGHEEPDRTVPAEYIFYDLWRDMRAIDHDMANDVLEPVFVFMRAQTDPARLRPMNLGEYFQYRERDVGKALLGALMRFSMGLRVTEKDLAAARPADEICSKHLSVINDIWSYDKEYVASETLHDEGGALCTCVTIVARDAELSIPATKRLLYSLCREWELAYKEEVNRILTHRDTAELRAYLDGLVLQMAGNELWSRTTLRYLEPTE